MKRDHWIAVTWFVCFGFVLLLINAAPYSATESQSPNHEPASSPSVSLSAELPASQDSVYPALPAFVRSVYGPVRVIVKPNLTYEGADVYGLWQPYIRTISIRAGLAPWYAYGVLQHEVCHVAISDAEIFLPESVEEAVCNAIARQRSIEAYTR